MQGNQSLSDFFWFDIPRHKKMHAHAKRTIKIMSSANKNLGSWILLKGSGLNSFEIAWGLNN